MGRQQSLTNGGFGEAKLQRLLSGGEVKKCSVVSRPIPNSRCVNGSTAGIGVEHVHIGSMV